MLWLNQPPNFSPASFPLFNLSSASFLLFNSYSNFLSPVFPRGKAMNCSCIAFIIAWTQRTQVPQNTMLSWPSGLCACYTETNTMFLILYLKKCFCYFCFHQETLTQPQHYGQKTAALLLPGSHLNFGTDIKKTLSWPLSSFFFQTISVNWTILMHQIQYVHHVLLENPWLLQTW